MGSIEISRLGYREGFAFIGIKGMKSPIEKRTKRKYDEVSVTRVFALDQNAVFPEL